MPLKSATRRDSSASPPVFNRHLNDAFETADMAEVCTAIDGLIRLQSVSRIAQKSGIERAHLYGAFSSERGPRLSTVMSVLKALRLQLLVKPKQNSCKLPRQQDVPETRQSPKVRSQRKSTAQFLNKAFDTSDLRSIAQAFGQVIRAQENVSEFARQAGLERTRLYRCFGGNLTPEFSAVLGVVNALDLQLLAKQETRSVGLPATERTRRTGTMESTVSETENRAL
jgi:probable addiction module antidote protein